MPLFPRTSLNSCTPASLCPGLPVSHCSALWPTSLAFPKGMCNRHGVVCAPRLGDVRFSSAVCHCSLLFLSSGGLSVHSRMSVHLLKGMAHACEVALPRLGSISAVHVFSFPLPSRLLPCLRFGTQLSLRTDLVSTEFLFCRFLLHYCSFDCSLCLL